MKVFYKFLFIAFCVVLVSTNQSNAQIKFKNYELLAAPDAWYNDIDGIRLGLRLKGMVPGMFDDGPHRLDFGVWLGTWIPDDPVSYYMSFTEPIPSISSFGSEGAIEFISSVRTGYHRHGIGLKKRWQKGFNEFVYKEASFYVMFNKRYDRRYVEFPVLWQEDALKMAKIDFEIGDENALGRMAFKHNFDINLPIENDAFIRYKGVVNQEINIKKRLNLDVRGFLGIASDNTTQEYRFSHSYLSPVEWVERGLTRAEGTIPENWIRSGTILVDGGPNLRGYTEQDIDAVKAGLPPFLQSIGTLNLELNYPNPVDKKFNNIPVLGDFVQMRSYVFFDTGSSLGIGDFEQTNLLSDAGFGFNFSLNIPDYLGKPRGFKIRYDVPFWLSDPGTENNIKYRNIIAVGAIISL